MSTTSFFGRLSNSARNSFISSKDYNTTIQLLEDSETIDTEYKKSDNGQVLLDYVCNHLNIIEKDYFGLRFQDANKHRYWLDTTKPIVRQIRGPSGAAFRFRIRYYPADPTVLKEEITRYQLFTQLRRDLLHGRLYCPQNDAALLGAYIIQSDLGDYDPMEHKDGYVSEYKLFLKQTAKTEDKIAQIHRTLIGMTPADVEMEFLKKAAQLDTYGFDPHTVKDAKQNSIYIGVNHHGILVYQANHKIHHIKWNELDKVDYVGKEFRVYPSMKYLEEHSLFNASDKTSNGGMLEVGDHKESNGITTDDGIGAFNRSINSDASAGSKTAKKAVNVKSLKYMCPSATFAKHLWRHTLSQQAFFTEPTAQHFKPKFSKPRIPLISRGSTFRYSGRVLHEIEESDAPIRDAPTKFLRYHVERQTNRDERQLGWLNKSLPIGGIRTTSNANKLKSDAPPVAINNWQLSTDKRQIGNESHDADSPLSVEREKVTTFTIHLSRSEPSPKPDNSLLNNTNAYQSDFDEFSKTTQPIANSTPKSAYDRRTNSVLSANKRVNGSSTSTSVFSSVAHYFFMLFFIILFVTIAVVVIFEIQDTIFRQYVHSVPGVEHMRHVYYEPSRNYILMHYGRLIGGDSWHRY